MDVERAVVDSHVLSSGARDLLDLAPLPGLRIASTATLSA